MAGKNTVEIILSAKDQASKAVASAMGTVRGSASVAMGAIAAGAAAAGAAMATLSAAISKVGIEYNAMKEQSMVAWTTLLGTQEEAKKMLKDISDFTKATPFETAEVDMMAKYMHNAGLEGKALFDELLKVSDVASAFAVPAAEAKEMTRQMSQVRQAGLAYTEDLNILQDRGVPIYKAIAEAIGGTVADVKKMASEGKLTSDIYIEAFNNIAKGVEGASKDQSKTFLGMISTLKDNLKLISGEITKGLFENLKGALESFMPILERFSDTLTNKGLRAALEEFLPPSVASVIFAVSDAVNFLTDGLKATYDMMLGTGDMKWFVDNFGLDKAVAINNFLWDLVDGFKLVKDGVVNYLGFVKDYWVGAFETMKSMFSGEGDLGATFLRIFETIKSIALPIFKDAIDFIKSTLSDLKAFWDENGAQIIAAVKNFFTVIAAIFQAIAPVLLFIIDMIWTTIKGIISGALDVIMGLIKVFSGLFTGDFSKMWEGIKQLFFGAIEFVWNLVNLLLIGRILGGIKAFITNGVSAFSGFWTKTVEIFKNLDTHVWNIITGFVSKIGSTLKGFVDEGVRVFGTLRTFGASIFEALGAAIRTTASNIYSSVVGFFQNMFTGARFQFEGLLSSAKSIFSQIGSAITSPIDTAKTMVGKAIEGIKGFFKNFPKVKFGLETASKTILGKTITYPTGFDVDWYDKGGVFYGPQVIGVGEKRPEFVGALDDLRKIVREESGGSKGDTIVNVYGSNVDITEERLIQVLRREEMLYG